MSKTFKQAIEASGPILESILNIMKIGRGDDRFDIEKERSFLSVVNQIIDYYVQRDDQSLRIPVVYFPICNENSQELCEEFLTIKLGLFSNENWRMTVCYLLNLSTRNGWVLKNDENTPQLKILSKANYNYEKDLMQILNNCSCPQDCTSLIYSNYLLTSFNQYKEAQRESNRRLVNKYWYLAKAINGNYSSKNECPLSFISGEAETFYNYLIKTNEETDIKIENLIFFPCNSPDGDYSEFCTDIVQKAYFDDFVNARSGLRNVFIFRFSRKPYRLRRIIDVNNLMKKDKIGIHADDDSYDFISFSYDEAALLFNHNRPAIFEITIGENVDEHKEFEETFDSILECLDSKYILRCNEVAMCVNDEMSRRCSEILSSEAEIDETILSQILTINQELWYQHSTILTHFLDEPDVCVVVGNGIDEELKRLFMYWLIQKFDVENVHFTTFGDLKGKLVNGKYQNGIQFKRIIVLSFRNDYTKEIFHKYPNSFDPICINEDQKVIVISNLFALRRYYGWGNYNYTMTLKKALKSKFRSDMMKTMIKDVSEPQNLRYIEDHYDEDNDQNYRQIPTITVNYTDSTSRSLIRSEWMLYQWKKEDRAILPLSDLADLYSDSAEGLFVQPISFLVNVITNDYLEKKKADDTKSEKLFKEQPIYALTDDQKTSNVQLWKILLQRKIDEQTIEVVYHEISSQFRISFGSFSKWPNEDYGLPRENKMQEYLIKNYLGIKDPYLKIVRKLKEKMRNNTESINANIRHFLSISLLSNDYKGIYNSLNDEIRDLLSLESADDVKALIELVNEKINLEPIKSFKL